jgi:Xaa-Pro aminopeptidase
MLLNRERADTVMDANGLAALVASTPRNVYYLTDWQTDGGWAFPGVAAAIVPRDHDVPAAVLTIDVDLEWPGAREATWVPVVRGYPGMEALVTRHHLAVQGELVRDPPGDARPFDPIAAVGEYLGEVGLDAAHVGFEDVSFGLLVTDRVGQSLDVIAAGELLRLIRMVKTDEELALLRAGTRKNELAQLVAMESVAAGASFAEAQRVYFTSMIQMGGTGEYLAGVVSRPGVGPLVDGEALQPRDAVFFDAFGGYRHYSGDVGRTAIVGPPAPEQVKAFGALRDAWAKTWPQIRPGLDSRALAAMVMQATWDAGGEEYAICSPHSVGLEHFDHPHPGSIYEPFVVEEGMVLSVDMPYQSAELGMFHTEDLVHVGADGVEFLTSNDDRLLVIAHGALQRVD